MKNIKKTIAKLKELEAKVTPGPWKDESSECLKITAPLGHALCRLIAEIESLQEQVNIFKTWSDTFLARAEKAEKVIKIIAYNYVNDGCWHGYNAEGCEYEQTDEKICTACWYSHIYEYAENKECLHADYETAIANRAITIMAQAENEEATKRTEDI